MYDHNLYDHGWKEFDDSNCITKIISIFASLLIFIVFSVMTILAYPVMWIYHRKEKSCC